MDPVMRRILKGAAVAFVGTGLGYLLAFLWRAAIARAFTPSEYGLFVLGVTVVTFFSMLGMVGLHEGAPREIAARKKKEVVASVLWIVGATGLLSFFLCYLSADFIGSLLNAPELSDIIRLLSPAVPFYVWTLGISSVFRGKEMFKSAVFVRNVLVHMSVLVLVAAALLSGANIATVALAYVAGWALTFTFTFLWYVKKVNVFGPPTEWKTLLSFSLPLLASQMMNFIMAWTDTFMIGYFLDTHAVGIYNAAVPFMVALTAVLAAVGYSFVPVASRSLLDNRKALEEKYRKVTLLTFLLTFPLATACVLFPDVIVTTVFGDKYVEASLPLAVLSAGILIHASFGPNGRVLVSTGYSRKILLVNVAAALVNVVLNALLIPVYGLVGGAMATVMALITFNVLASVLLFMYERIHAFSTTYVYAVLLSIAYALIFHFLPVGGLPAVVAYVLIYYALSGALLQKLPRASR